MSEEEEIRATNALRSRIEAAQTAGKADYQALSLLVRPTNKSYIQQFVTRGSPRKMPPWMRDKLSAALDEADTITPTKQPNPPAPTEGPITPEMEDEYLARLRAADPIVRRAVLTLLGLRP